jgi:Uncharacterized conserved protein
MKRKSLFYPYTVDNIHPGFSVDCVILSFHKKKLHILLNKFDVNKYWQLPGGFMLKSESSDDAAKRVLAHRTGLSGIYLKQFQLFSDPERTKIDQNSEYLEKNAIKREYTEDDTKWFLQRFVSLGYYAFVKYDNVKLVFADEDVAKWFDICNLPALYSDHDNIIKTALEKIYSLLPILPIGYELLPEKFTISELRKIYEIILDKPLDRRNFQRKVLSSGVVIQLDEVRNTSPYNPPILYSFSENVKDMTDFSVFLM